MHSSGHITTTSIEEEDIFVVRGVSPGSCLLSSFAPGRAFQEKATVEMMKLKVLAAGFILPCDWLLENIDK